MSPATRYSTTDDDWNPATGRHAFNEDAVLTPIFHALTRGGWRSRQHEPAAPALPPVPPAPPRAPDPVDAFRRDPLTAPIPIQTLAPAAIPVTPSSGTGAHAVPAARHELVDQGRHHRRREAVTSHW